MDKILVIKQTSLGDVLHSTGHVRLLKESFPDNELILLTAKNSIQIYENNSSVSQIILFDRDLIKYQWYKNPVKCYRHIKQVLIELRVHDFDLAFDLQGLARSVLFLYAARANRKFVKGRWLGLNRFRDKSLHAITEMDRVLALAGIAGNTAMEFSTSEHETQVVDKLLSSINPELKPLLILSPFSRWQSKDWPLINYLEVARQIPKDILVIFTGATDREQEIELAIKPFKDHKHISNLAGKLSIPQFADLVRRAKIVLTGDSFPMHVASACNTPLIALFGPTDERKVGPKNDNAKVVVAPDCNRCDRRDCTKNCLARISTDTILKEINGQLADL